jgi:hypothetical protein
VSRPEDLFTVTSKKTNPAAAKSSKPKTALNLRDLPPRKDPVGGRKQEQNDK